MDHIISATQARIHFGEVIRWARSGPVFVERDGKSEVVVISKQEYDQLVTAAPKKDWQKTLEELHEKLRIELAGRSLPDSANLIQQGREERDEQLHDSLH